MTIYDLLVFLKKYVLFISVVSMVAALAFLTVSLKIQPSFEASQTLFVKRQASLESKSFYTYDGYYSAQAAERFADSAFGALKSQDFLKLMIGQIETEDKTMGRADKVARAIKVKRISPQLISLSYENKDQRQASSLVQILTKSSSDLLLSLNRGGDEGISISFVSDQPIITTHHLSPGLATAVGFLLGIFFSLVVLGSYQFLKNFPK